MGGYFWLWKNTVACFTEEKEKQQTDRFGSVLDNTHTHTHTHTNTNIYIYMCVCVCLPYKLYNIYIYMDIPTPIIFCSLYIIYIYVCVFEYLSY